MRVPGSRARNGDSSVPGLLRGALKRREWRAGRRKGKQRSKDVCGLSRSLAST